MNKVTRIAVVLVVWVSSALPVLAQTQPANPTPPETPAFPAANITERVVGEASPDSQVVLARSSDDHIVWVEKQKGKGKTVRMDSKQLGAVYDDVEHLSLSDDGNHVIFTAKRQSKWVLVVDDRERTAEYRSITEPLLSADGQSFAAVACQDKKCRLLINGQPVGGEFDEIISVAFSDGGAHYSFVGRRKKTWVSVVDGKESTLELEEVIYSLVSPDKAHVALLTVIKKRKLAWDVDGMTGPHFDLVSDIAFSPDGKHFAYAGAERKGGMLGPHMAGSLVIDGKVTTTYSGARNAAAASTAAQTPLLSRLKQFEVNIDGLSDPEYLPDGRLMYSARRGDKDVVVFINDVPGPSFEDIVSGILLAQDAKLMVYVAKRGDMFIEVRNQVPGASYPGKRFADASFVDHMITSEDGSHLAYEIVRGGRAFNAGFTLRALRRIVVDSQAGHEYDALGLSGFHFSADGHHYAYEVHGADKDRGCVVFDGLEGKLYDSVFLKSVRFLDNRSIEFVVQDGQKFMRVTEKLS